MGYTELFFYGGIVIAAGSFLIGIVSFVVLKIQSSRLRAKLEEEYGPKEEK